MRARGRALRHALGALALLSLAASFARDARASACGPPLASSCINDDTLWPHAGPSHFFAIGSTETVGASQLGFGLVTSYLSRPVVLHVPTPGPGGTDAYAVNDQVNTTFLFSYGVTSRLELDAALPITFGQGGAGTTPITGGNSSTAFQDTALRDFRFGFAYAILGRPRVDPRVATGDFALTARMEVSAPTGDQSQFGGERTAVWIPSVAADYRAGRLFAGAEVGARLRPVTELAGARVGSQLALALGAGVDLLPHALLAASVAARALPTFAEQHDAIQTRDGIVSTPNGKSISPAEWTIALRTAPLAGGDLSFQLGGGGSIPLSSDPAITNPRFRFSLGLRYEPLTRDTDGDGILDKDDRCPEVRGVRGSADGDGCAAPPPPLNLDIGPSTPPPAPAPAPST